jgi:hypothetical protein
MRYVDVDKSHSKKVIGFNKHAEYSRCESLGREKENYSKARKWFDRTPYALKGSNNVRKTKY